MKFFSKSLRDIPFVKIVISVVMVVVVSIVIGIGMLSPWLQSRIPLTTKQKLPV